MPPVTEINNSIIPSNNSARGPKYNEDANFLDENDSSSDASDAVATEEEEDSEEADTLKTNVKKNASKTKEELDNNENEDESEEDDENKEERKLEEEKPNIFFDRPTIKEIKDKYPDFFKDFPQMKDSYFREIEFTKLFPTAEDAREALEENEAFTTLSDSVLTGDPSQLMESIGKTDSRALEVFSSSFLPTLYKKNQELYNQVVAPLFQNLVKSLYSNKDENTRNAALLLSDYLFGEEIGEGIAKGTKSVVKDIRPTEEQNKIRDQREQNLNTAFRASAGKVQENITKSLESMVIKSSTFDPNKVFSPSLRRLGAAEVIKRLMKTLSSDNAHIQVMAARWKRARSNGFTSEDESKIISTYLARAKSLIPGISSKVSQEMLGTKVRHAEDKSDRTRTFPKQNLSGGSGSRSAQTGNKDYSKMSDLDILNS